MVSNSEINQAWKVNETFTVEQAASLMAGIDPTKIEFDPLPPHFRDSKSDAAENDAISYVSAHFQLLQNAINDKKLEAKTIYSAKPRGNDDKTSANERIAWMYEWYDNSKDGIGKQDMIICNIPDWSRTTVHRGRLKAWLIGIGHNDNFFNTESDAHTGNRSFMNPDHPRYSPELAMAVTAWEALEGKDNAIEEEIEEWIKEHAKDISKFLNIKEVETGIAKNKLERISTVVGWNGPGRRRKELASKNPPKLFKK
jgi:hypothetical protein